MSDRIKALIEQRDAAQKHRATLGEQRDKAQDALEAFVKPFITSGTALTEEQETEKATLRSAVEKLDEQRAEAAKSVEGYDARIDEISFEESRSSKLNELRKGLGHVEVIEPTVYGKGSENSYFLDLAYASNPLDSRNADARDRLLRASHEAAVEMVSNKSEEVREKIRATIKEEHRNTNQDKVREAVKRAEALGATGRSELRTGMDTTSGSGGSFATPVYFIQKYAPYREAGRAFVDQCNKQELPSYGMTVYLPHVTGPAGVAAQATQNTGVQETDPTAGYLSANLTTEAGQVTISQQLLDRAGPGFAFDALVIDQLERDYAPKVDTSVLTSALAGAGIIAYTDSTGFHMGPASGAGVGGFTGKISNAKQTIRKAAGVYMNPTHLFVDPARWEYVAAWNDSNGRPVVVPDYAGPYNAFGAGSADGDAGIEGATGYRLNGLKSFTDANIPAPTAGNDQAIIGNLAEVYVFEGTPIVRTLPQTLGNQLSVIIQLYSYLATIVRYPTAVQTIVGTGMATPTF